jgi:hypothetical protein
MNFDTSELRIAKQAIELILTRKRIVEKYFSDRPEGFTSVLNEIGNLTHTDSGIDGYTKSQLVNAITKPWAVLFFLSHRPDDDNVVEKLADYIERNTYSIPAWYDFNE